jgi:hypothetical protein
LICENGEIRRTDEMKPEYTTSTTGHKACDRWRLPVLPTSLRIELCAVRRVVRRKSKYE